VNDDWRVRAAAVGDPATELIRYLEDLGGAKPAMNASFDDRVIVSRTGDEVFCYAGTREQAESTEDLIRSFAVEHGWDLPIDLKHWHDDAEQWEDPDLPLPETDAERAAERASLMEMERPEEAKSGHPEFEVRIDCHSHREARAFAEKLRAEGLPSVHRWKYILVGAADEDSAEELAERMRLEAPPHSSVKVEGTWKAVREEVPPNPFAVFGGLGT
jgi:hypothetical protein